MLQPIVHKIINLYSYPFTKVYYIVIKNLNENVKKFVGFSYKRWGWGLSIIQFIYTNSITGEIRLSLTKWIHKYFFPYQYMPPYSASDWVDFFLLLLLLLQKFCKFFHLNDNFSVVSLQAYKLSLENRLKNTPLIRFEYMLY